MTFHEFYDTVENAKRKNPVWFGLAHDNIPTEEEISSVEDALQVKFPEQYKAFLRVWGGGYFGLTIVYSCDPDSRFYLPRNVTADWAAAHQFLPVVDFETGDLGGFPIQGGVCGECIALLDHERQTICETGPLDFYTFLLAHGLGVIPSETKQKK